MAETVGRYELVRELGRGAMGRVHLAREPNLGREVALKQIDTPDGSGQAAARFLREARLAGSLSHPNIVTVFEYFEVDGTPYIAMEYVPGGSLRQYWAGVDLAGFVGVMEGMLAGLAHADNAGVVHRDLKPENIMVTADGAVKIGDFGLAKATEAAGDAFATRSGVIVGTPRYMAPEQILGGEVGVWSDLYSLGVMAYEQLVGAVPFNRVETPTAVLMCHLNETIPPAHEVRSDINPDISAWIDRLLIKDPIDRIRDPQKAWEQLEEIVLFLLGARWRRSSRLPVTSISYSKPQSRAVVSIPTILTASRPLQECGQRPQPGGNEGEAHSQALPSPALPPSGVDDLRPSNLPASLPVLIGRDESLAEITRLLTADDERLVTVTGRGGAGKTSLALIVGTRLLEEHPGGVWLARLATAGGPDQLLSIVASAVGAEGKPGGSLLEAIAARLSRGGPTLLILDNLERLLAATSEITALLDALPDLRVLTTSQKPLRLDGEYVYALDGLGEGAAVELMARVAHRRAVPVTPDEPGRAALLDIARLLDGLPLALELAAARLVLMTPEQLHERLLGSLELLHEDRADRPNRQRSLLATVDWTLELLDEPSRALFSRLGVFVGPVGLDDIEAVAGGNGVDVTDALPKLLDVALVRRVAGDHGRVYFNLPEALRQLAVRRLDTGQQTQVWRRAHAERMNEIITSARTVTVPLPAYQAALAADDEVAAALQWARTTDDPLAIPLAVGRTMVLTEQGHLREALEVSEPLADVTPTDPDLHAWTIACRVYPTLFLNRLAEAQNLAHRALGLAVRPLTETLCLEACGLAHVLAGDAQTGLNYHLQATAAARRLDPATLAGALCLQAQAQLSSGDPNGAEETVAEALQIGAPADANFLWKRETIYGDIAMARGRPQEALAHYVSSIRAAQMQNNQLQTMFDLVGAAITLATLRRDADALELVGMLRAEVSEHGGVGVELVSHYLGGEEIAGAEQRQGPTATAAHLARGHSVPAEKRIAHVYALAQTVDPPASGQVRHG